MAWTFPLTTDSNGNLLDSDLGFGSENVGIRTSDGNTYDYSELTGNDGAIYAGWLPVLGNGGGKPNWIVILILSVLAMGVGYYLIKSNE